MMEDRLRVNVVPTQTFRSWQTHHQNSADFKYTDIRETSPVHHHGFAIEREISPQRRHIIYGFEIEMKKHIDAVSANLHCFDIENETSAQRH